MRSSAGIRSNQGVGPRAALRSATTSTGLPDPRHLLGRLRKRTVVAAVAGFGAFFGLATLNVVGVTAHPTAAGGGAGANAQAPAALPPGDFFGTPGAAVHGSAGGQAVQPVQPVTPLLGNGGGAAMLSSGGS